MRIPTQSSCAKIIYIYGNTMELRHVQTVSDAKILVYGFFWGSKLKFTANDSLTDTTFIPLNFAQTNGFVAIYDSSGKFISANKTFMGLHYGLGQNGKKSGHNNHLGEFSMDSKGCFYLNFHKDSFPGSINFRGGSLTLHKDSIEKYIVVKYSQGFDSILWYKEFPNIKKFQIERIRTGDDDNLYLACNVPAGSNFTLNGKPYRYQNYPDKAFLSILSPNGSFIHNSLINSDSTQGDNLWDIGAKDTNTIYVLGYVEDSIHYKNKWYSSFNKKAQKRTFRNAFPYVGSIGLSKGANWIKLPSVRSYQYKLNPHKSGYSTERLTYDKSGHIYTSFWANDSLLTIGGLSYKVPWGELTKIAFVKFDKVGNALWIKPFSESIRDMASTPDSNLVYTGYFTTDDFFINPFYFKKGSYYATNHAFIAKTDDYAIIREYVAPGPYCAGDTLDIPYYRFGKYDTSNYFIAELSDEKGDFEGGERELGRLKTTNDGTVKCTIPLFKVSSSSAYRIRIRSTSPSVQSFYKRDTLQLLIYSRDKADPGPTETICMGDSIKLNTYGGTKWTWSPKYNMSDSTLRQPLAWPTKDTIYKIIIADSSGCGAPDTAFKKILVRTYPTAHLQFTDTAICGNAVLKIPVAFAGGDSNYKWQWFFVFSKSSFFPSVKGSSKLSDTLTYTPTEPNETMAIVLKDGCTAKADTAYITISQRNPVVIKNQFKDTLLCSGNYLKYKAIGSGGIPKQYRYQWKDLVDNSVLSNTDSLIIITSKTLKIQLIVNDGCEALGDTAIFEVKVKAELKASTNLRDTIICSGKTLNYTAQATGGDSKNYTYSWLLNNKEISTSNLLNLKSDILNLTSNLSLITSDNCSPNDTITKIITVIPSPKADFTWDLACSRTLTKFKFTGTKPNSPITTQFHWNFNNEAASSLENPSHLFAKSGTSTSTLTLTSNNGCTDTVNKKIEVKVQAKADFTATDVCESDSAIFINTSKDATSYKWKFGDAQTSNLQTPKHKYLITSTTTFNVSLVAVVDDGCSDSIGKAITINKNPDATFTYTQTGNKLELKAKAGYSNYKWKMDAKDSFSTANANYTYTLKTWNPLSICLKTTDLNGCFSESCKTIPLGISDISIRLRQIKLYPNPNTGNFTIEIENLEKDVSIEVFDVMGKLVRKVERVGKVNLIDLSVVDGIYVVKVKNGTMMWNQKVLVSFDGANR